MTMPTTACRHGLLALSIACALSLPLGAHAQSTTKSSSKGTTREQQLEQRVNQLEQQLAELKAMIQDQKSATTQATQTAQAAQATADQANTTAKTASTKVEAAAPNGKPTFSSAPGLSVALHGFISASGFGQDKTFVNYGNGQNALVVAPQTPANKANGYDGSLSGFDVRNTRFWLDFSGAKFNEDWGGGGRIEMDFFGGNNGTGAYSQQQPIPRLRQAYMDIVNPNSGSTIRIGQQWDFMFPLDNTPTSLAHIAFPLGYGTGFVGWRFPGVTWMQDLNHGSDGVKWRLDLGLFEGNWNGPQNELGTANTNYLNAGAANFRPQLEARLRAVGADWLAYFVAHYSQVKLNGVGDIVLHPRETTLDSVGYELGGQWKPGPWTFKGLIYSGKALGEIFGAMSQFGDISESGGWLQASYNFTPKWSVNGFFGMVRPNHDDVVTWTTTSATAGTALLRNNQSALSLQYASGNYELGVEWMYDKVRWQLGSEGARQSTNGNQVSLNGLYRF